VVTHEAEWTGRVMSRTSYENYGAGAEQANLTVVAGRYASQGEAERLIVVDVVTKLDLCPGDDLLEIGCGAGNLLIPLAFLCRSATGIDHPALLARLLQRFPESPQITLLSGNFLDVQPDVSYSKILMYAMLHYQSSMDEVLECIDKAASLLRPRGRMLLGDLPNADHKRRFLATRAGKTLDREWTARRSEAAPSEEDSLWDGDPRLVGSFDDKSIVEIMRTMREAGFEAYVLEQRPELPFGCTREDILVVAGDK
jgi:SAM-dependent methyltransferase